MAIVHIDLIDIYMYVNPCKLVLLFSLYMYISKYHMSHVFIFYLLFLIQGVYGWCATLCIIYMYTCFPFFLYTLSKYPNVLSEFSYSFFIFF